MAAVAPVSEICRGNNEKLALLLLLYYYCFVVDLNRSFYSDKSSSTTAHPNSVLMLSSCNGWGTDACSVAAGYHPTTETSTRGVGEH